MLLTEDEARKKWCPNARAIEMEGGKNYGPFNRDIGGLPGDWEPSESPHNSDICGCIASACMAWRWAPPQTKKHDDSAYISNIGISGRVFSMLKGAGYITVGDVRKSPDWDLLKIPNFGRGSLAEIRNATEQSINIAAKIIGYCGAFGCPTE